MPSSVSMRRVTKLRSGEQMISLAAVIFMNSFPETISFIDEVEVGRGAKHDQIEHPKHNPKSLALPRLRRLTNFFALNGTSPSSTRQPPKTSQNRRSDDVQQDLLSNRQRHVFICSHFGPCILLLRYLNVVDGGGFGVVGGAVEG